MKYKDIVASQIDFETGANPYFDSGTAEAEVDGWEADVTFSDSNNLGNVNFTKGDDRNQSSFIH